MNMVANTQTNMDVSGMNQASVITKQTGVQKTSQQQSGAVQNPVAAQAQADKSSVSKKDVHDMVEALKDLTETLKTTLNFSVDDRTNNIIVKIVDKDTDKVIRQIPPEDLLTLQEKMQDLTGFLLSDNI
jgi:flagellar protein FlaG